MNKEKEFLAELKQFFAFGYDKIEEIRYKNDVYVARVFKDDRTYVAKYFENSEDAREIKNYQILKNLGIKTLEVYFLGKNLIVMQDINQLKGFRISVSDDIKDEKFLKNIAMWYKSLHTLGKTCDLAQIEYSEYNCITKENILKLKKVLDDSKVEMFLDSLPFFQKISKQLEYTLVYNDFYFDNIVKSENEAFMFDYDLLGKGNVISDLNNVKSCLGEEKMEIFKKYYGKIDLKTNEKEYAYILSNVSSLIQANERKEFPKWANSVIQQIKSEKFEENLIKLEKEYSTKLNCK